MKIVRVKIDGTMDELTIQKLKTNKTLENLATCMPFFASGCLTGSVNSDTTSKIQRAS